MIVGLVDLDGVFTDDPFFVDLGGVFDLGNMPRQGGDAPRDGVACMNTSAIVMEIPIPYLLKRSERL